MKPNAKQQNRLLARRMPRLQLLKLKLNVWCKKQWPKLRQKPQEQKPNVRLRKELVFRPLKLSAAVLKRKGKPLKGQNAKQPNVKLRKEPNVKPLSVWLP